MPYIAINKHNPFGLTLRQQLFIAHLVTAIRMGKPIKPKECIKRVYDVKTDATARSMASEYLSKPNIVKALQHELKKVGLVGNNSKVERRLTEGLDAVTSNGMVDYTARLHYIQEIHKIVGLYNANC
ncbi:hypothetical protein A2690_00490 [Candidatus Roizmanbacteria bacterium RIFCSPHIGHO2_01_FULL_39_12b]|uniref:Uncharacterized protein n=1 Tax=Candidatus Roizmanbacteria bacterium RIFCSPHIGHO2_01_FULL_39_12b TaxID=1802030 RepID=A0A1F7G910_9BACT|nr:MAG: hypothetical protein A2690_00490 [Candidatus Roizmanbacteria bacterium RIFCSPHIGHO2_01_FULL_39_12b]OGK46038.1 MAG: hypothetical protein A3B46_00780 [Candidatus Roizmanbacteria bacterium RIFCSPLOWO2_01_FULL_39_19]